MKEVLQRLFTAPDGAVKRFVLGCVKEYNPDSITKEEFPFYLAIRYCEALELLSSSEITDLPKLFWDTFPETPMTDTSSTEADSYWYEVRAFAPELYQSVVDRFFL